MKGYWTSGFLINGGSWIVTWKIMTSILLSGLKWRKIDIEIKIDKFRFGDK